MVAFGPGCLKTHSHFKSQCCYVKSVVARVVSRSKIYVGTRLWAVFSGLVDRKRFYTASVVFRPVMTNRFGLLFAVATVFYEQVHPLENIHVEMDDGRQVRLAGCLSMTSRATHQQLPVVP